MAKLAKREGRYPNVNGEYRKYGRLWTKVRKIVLDRDERTCCLCGAQEGGEDSKGKPVVLEVDHILAFQLGGAEFDLDNVAVMCKSCNRAFGQRRKPAHVEAMLVRLAMQRNRALA